MRSYCELNTVRVHGNLQFEGRKKIQQEAATLSRRQKSDFSIKSTAKQQDHAESGSGVWY